MAKAQALVNDPDLYESDFYRWTELMAERLRQRDAAGIDWDNIAEEIESLGRSDKRSLKNRLRVIILHLLKWKHQPEHRSGSWKASIVEQRRQVISIIEDSPSLLRYLSTFVDTAYSEAAVDAVEEMRLFQNPFPDRCPFTPDQILSRDFWPDQNI